MEGVLKKKKRNTAFFEWREQLREQPNPKRMQQKNYDCVCVCAKLTWVPWVFYSQ